MRRFFVSLALVLAVVGIDREVRAANNFPVILVHGFAGFGRDEMLGYRYWGGLTDLQQYLNSQGHPTHTAAVGPFSSNWDRAVELYYQIKGGCVDYGANHSAAHGHLRTVPTKCYPGFYPQWDAAHPVHLVSHSMGGQTSRMLVQMLETQTHSEDGTPGESPLFTGGKAGWVKSVTTIATPNNGTTLANVVDNLAPFAQQLIAEAATLANITDPNGVVYDFKMEQWGLQRQPGESFTSYQARVLSSPVFTNPNLLDISAYDLSPDGAAAGNAWVGTLPDVYYFSFATRATFTGFWPDWEYPRMDMLAPLGLTAYPYLWPLPPGMGNYTRNEWGHVVIDKTWWSNDGVVNTVSMRNPKGQPVVDFNGTPQVGKWNYMGLSDTFDHMDIIGWTFFWDSRPFYLNHVRRLKNL